MTNFRLNISTLSKMRRRSEADIRSRYKGFELSQLDVEKILRAEKEGAPCSTCKGLPCAKKVLPCVKPTVSVDGDSVKVTNVICQFEQNRRRQNTIKRNFANAQIPQPYLGKTSDDYREDANNANAVKWARVSIAEGAGLYLYGCSGCGKTFLAALIAQELLKTGKTVIFCDVPSLLESLKATFDGDTRIEELMSKLATADMLIMDDLGAEYPTEWAASRLYMIINQRYNAEKPIIVTSNLNPLEANDKLNSPKNAPLGVHGDRIISRLRQMCRIAQIKGGDRRRR